MQLNKWPTSTEGIDSAVPGDHPPPLHCRSLCATLACRRCAWRPVSLSPVCISLSSYLITDTTNYGHSNTTHSDILRQLPNISFLSSFPILTYHCSLSTVLISFLIYLFSFFNFFSLYFLLIAVTLVPMWSITVFHCFKYSVSSFVTIITHHFYWSVNWSFDPHMSSSSGNINAKNTFLWHFLRLIFLYQYERKSFF